MSAAVAAAAAAALSSRRSATASSTPVQNSHQYNHHHHFYRSLPSLDMYPPPAMSRYESQKRRDWNSFVQYLRKHHSPPLKLSSCDGDDVVVYLRYLSQTKIQQTSFGGLISRLRVAFEENGGSPETNPFCSRAVRLYKEEVKINQTKASA